MIAVLCIFLPSGTTNKEKDEKRIDGKKCRGRKVERGVKRLEDDDLTRRGS